MKCKCMMGEDFGRRSRPEQPVDDAIGIIWNGLRRDLIERGRLMQSFLNYDLLPRDWPLFLRGL